jgi:hypothetical protein
MLYILSEEKNNIGQEFILVQLHTACCKDKKLFMKLEEDKYLDVMTNEPASEGWNKQILMALKAKKEIL